MFSANAIPTVVETHSAKKLKKRRFACSGRM